MGKTLKLKQIRKDKKLTMGYIARRSGVAVTTILMVETGQQKPSLDMCQQLARALEVRPQDIDECNPDAPSVRPMSRPPWVG